MNRDTASGYGRCPCCGVFINNHSQRLVLDSCGHRKCRKCLLVEENSCSQCISAGDSALPLNLEFRNSNVGEGSPYDVNGDEASYSVGDGRFGSPGQSATLRNHSSNANPHHHPYQVHSVCRTNYTREDRHYRQVSSLARVGGVGDRLRPPAFHWSDVQHHPDYEDEDELTSTLSTNLQTGQGRSPPTLCSINSVIPDDDLFNDMDDDLDPDEPASIADDEMPVVTQYDLRNRDVRGIVGEGRRISPPDQGPSHPPDSLGPPASSPRPGRRHKAARGNRRWSRMDSSSDRRVSVIRAAPRHKVRIRSRGLQREEADESKLNKVKHIRLASWVYGQASKDEDETDSVSDLASVVSTQKRQADEVINRGKEVSNDFAREIKSALEVNVKLPGHITLKENPVKNENQYWCTICSKPINKKSFRFHKNCANKVEAHRCTECSRSFKSSSHLAYHTRSIHTGERPFQCNHCNRGFLQMVKLKRHLLIHTGEKPFSCDICSKAFRTRYHLKEHRNIHTVSTHHKCQVCHKTFADSNNFRRHMKSVHSRHKGTNGFLCNVKNCTSGNVIYETSFDLRSHKKEVHGEKKVKAKKKPRQTEAKKGLSPSEPKYNCNFCHLTFDQVTLLREHNEAVHSNDRTTAMSVVQPQTQPPPQSDPVDLNTSQGDQRRHQEQLVEGHPHSAAEETPSALGAFHSKAGCLSTIDMTALNPSQQVLHHRESVHNGVSIFASNNGTVLKLDKEASRLQNAESSANNVLNCNANSNSVDAQQRDFVVCSDSALSAAAVQPENKTVPVITRPELLPATQNKAADFIKPAIVPDPRRPTNAMTTKRPFLGPKSISINGLMLPSINLLDLDSNEDPSVENARHHADVSVAGPSDGYPVNSFLSDLSQQEKEILQHFGAFVSKLDTCEQEWGDPVATIGAGGVVGSHPPVARDADKVNYVGGEDRDVTATTTMDVARKEPGGDILAAPSVLVHAGRGETDAREAEEMKRDDNYPSHDHGPLRAKKSLLHRYRKQSGFESSSGVASTMEKLSGDISSSGSRIYLHKTHDENKEHHGGDNIHARHSSHSMLGFGPERSNLDHSPASRGQMTGFKSPEKHVRGPEPSPEAQAAKASTVESTTRLQAPEVEVTRKVLSEASQHLLSSGSININLNEEQREAFIRSMSKILDSKDIGNS